MALAIPVRSDAGTVLVDTDSGEVLDAVDASTPVALGRTADLLLIALFTHHPGFTRDAEVPLHVITPDPGPTFGRQLRAGVAELVQILLLTESRTAMRTLAAAAGNDALAPRLRTLCRALRLDATALSPSPVSPTSTLAAGITGTTSATDVARLAAVLLRDPAIRRRVGLDGVPIAGGAVIVRATAPLIATRAPVAAVAGERTDGSTVERTARKASAARPSSDAPETVGPAIAVAERDGLQLLAVATGPDASRVVWDVIEHGFSRYHRVPVVEAGAQVDRPVTVEGGILPAFNPKAAETFAVTARRDSAPTLALSLQLPPALEAPVDLNQRVGELVIERDGRVLGIVPLLAPMTIAPSRWLDTAARD